MSERLSAADVSFLYLESPSTPQHVGGIAIFDVPEGGFDYKRLIQLLEERISLVPRYRQKIRTVPGNIANPVWVDDPNFDIAYHARRSALPRPGSDEVLLEFCGQIQARLLDRNRPLWEMYFVEGLSNNRVAIVSKTHHSMVDGIGALDIRQVLLDASPEPHRTVGAVWMPRAEPRPRDLLLEALGGLAHRPTALAETVRLRARDAQAAVGWLTKLGGHALAAARPNDSAPAQSPLRVRTGEQRRIAVARTELADYRLVRQAHGGTINDVALTTVAGAVRGWLLSRGQTLRPAMTVRALVPVSVGDVGAASSGKVGSVPGPVIALLVDLPVGDPDPVRRLAQVRFAMQAHKASGRSVSADSLVALSGYAPPTLHALGARAANGLTRRLFSLIVTNVPGPQQPLYAAGARLTEMFPILPLMRGQAISVGITSYDGGVYYGINGDRDGAPDVARLATLVHESLAELVASSPGDRAGEATTFLPGRDSLSHRGRRGDHWFSHRPSGEQ